MVHYENDGQVPRSRGISKLGIEKMVFSSSTSLDDYSAHEDAVDDVSCVKEDPPPSSIIAPVDDASQNARVRREKHLSSKRDCMYVTMDHVPDLILDLESAVETSAERSLKALRMLCALSKRQDGCEGGNSHLNRIEMVHRFTHDRYDGSGEDHPSMQTGSLVPAILGFLKRCEVKSKEHYLTLMILNNISVPYENKKIIAFDHEGALLLGRLLYDDPSCHLLAVVLTNLTCYRMDAAVNVLSPCNESPTSKANELKEFLAFALRVASLTREEYEARLSVIEGCDDEATHTAAERLAILMAEDQKLRVKSVLQQQLPRTRSSLMYPSSTRWCLSALRNVAESKEVADFLIQSSVVSLILLQLINVRLDAPASESVSANAPISWSCNSIEDIALSIILKLAACPFSRDYLSDASVIKGLSKIAMFRRHPRMVLTKDKVSLQTLKAKMALACLTASQDHYMQANVRPSDSAIHSNTAESPVVMSDGEIKQLRELLDHSLHQSGKLVPGGYHSSTFPASLLLCSTRCLLSHTKNQCSVAKLVGPKLNALFVKALALHVLQPSSSMVDSESAEYACFSLYLQSSYGFGEFQFLPPTFCTSNTGEQGNMKNLSRRVLSAYLASPSVCSAGQHAARQLLLRMKFLNSEDKVACNRHVSSSCEWEESIIAKIKAIPIDSLLHGESPRSDISHRPIIRVQDSSKISGPNKSNSKTSFSSVLLAVQQISYGNIEDCQLQDIDEIRIANQIALCADGQGREFYGYSWAWKASNDIRRQSTKVDLERPMIQQGKDAKKVEQLRPPSHRSQYAATFLRIACGICAPDTTAS